MNHQAQSPTVSVMIPYYNCKEYIVETVQSVLSQSYQNFEIIIVDDGSDLEHADYLREFLADKRPPYVTPYKTIKALPPPETMRRGWRGANTSCFSIQTTSSCRITSKNASRFWKTIPTASWCIRWRNISMRKKAYGICRIMTVWKAC